MVLAHSTRAIPVLSINMGYWGRGDTGTRRKLLPHPPHPQKRWDIFYLEVPKVLESG
ncbi:MAG: hypothetical protein KME21_00020 [Desmonostoc vinosum HA7617-LM4]|nr:hypothetical protein [Desmonostoc vinosum HA7617-LM4]